MANEDDAEKELRQAAVVVPIRPDLPQDLPLIDIFETMLAELKTEIDKASGFKFTSEKLDQSFDLEDLLDDQGNSKSNQEGTIFSWIEEFIKQDELISQRSFDEEEMMTLITFLIRGCAIYGHKKGLRIGGFIEYSTATEDNYIIDAVMKISFREDYSDLEIDVEMAELMVSSLSGEELSLLMREQLNEELKNNGVNKELYDSDKYVWLQTIKETVNQKIKGVKSTKSSLVKEASEAKKASKPTDKAGANMTEEINIETIFKNMQENPRPSPDIDTEGKTDSPEWSGLTYAADSYDLEEFIDNINDNGLYTVDKVGDKKWFGQGAVGIELLYENVETQTPDETTRIRGFRLSFQCGVQLAMGLIEIVEMYDGEFEVEGRVAINFYNLETGSHDPANDSHGYWQEMYSDVQPVLEVEDDD